MDAPTTLLGDARLSSSLEWLSLVSTAQLAEASVAVETVQSDLRHAESRLAGEAEARNHIWERRLAKAKSEWQRGLDALRTECRSQLQEADRLVNKQKDESKRLREEVELRASERDQVAARLAATEAEARTALTNQRAAARRAEEAEAEAKAATAAADEQSAEHERARQKAEAERDVVLSAMKLSEDASSYLEIATDTSHSTGSREEAMLRAKLKSMSELMRSHAAGAAGAAHAVSDAEMQKVRAERRAAALEKRLHACEAELLARRSALVQAAGLGLTQMLHGDGGGGDGGGGVLVVSGGAGVGGGAVATQGDVEAAHLRKMAERCMLVEEMAEARSQECEALATQLVEARAEGRIAAETEAAWIARAEHAQARVTALEGLLAASEEENGALRREVQTRSAEVSAEVARQRAYAEGGRLAIKQQAAAERAAAAGVDIEALLAAEGATTGGEVSEPESPAAKPVGARKVTLADDLPSSSMPPASPPFLGVHGFSGMLPEGANNRNLGADSYPLPRCQAPYSSGHYYNAPSTGVATYAGGSASPSRASSTSGNYLFSRGGADATTSTGVQGVQPPSPIAEPPSPGAGGMFVDPSDSAGKEFLAQVGQGAQRQRAAQTAGVRAERDALAESLRLARREIAALRRAAEADAAQKMSLLSRLDAADERVTTAESRRGAFQSLAEAQAKELEKMHEQLDLSKIHAGGAARLQLTLENGAAAAAERMQLALRGEAMMREELQRAAVENDSLREKVSQTTNLLLTQETLVRLLGERLDAQSELARVQIGLPPLGPPTKAHDGPKSSIHGPPPRVVRLRLGPVMTSGDVEDGPAKPGRMVRQKTKEDLEAALAAADAAIAASPRLEEDELPTGGGGGKYGDAGRQRMWWEEEGGEERLKKAASEAGDQKRMLKRQDSKVTFSPMTSEAW